MQLQHWQHWPKKLVVECHEYTPDNDGGVSIKHYVPEVTCFDASKYADRFRCSLCGVDLDVTDADGEPTMLIDGVAQVPRFCPVCGARIDDER